MKILLLLLALSFSSVALYAQKGLLKTIGGAARNKVEQQDFNSTRTNKEKLDDNDRPRSAPAPSPASEAVESDSTQAPVSGGGQAAGYDQSYTFTQKTTYELQDLKKAKSEKTSMTHFYSDNAIMSVTNAEMNMIFDFVHESMIMLNEKEMTAIVMSTKSTMNIAAGKQMQASGNATVTKTGKTKQILGYRCEEYLITDDEHTSNCWVTSEIGIDGAKAAKAMGMQTTNSFGEDGKGMMMELTTYDKKGTAETHLIMTEYKEESTTKSLSGYAVTAI